MRLPEFMVLLTLGVFWIVPIVAAVWALVTLQRIRSVQEEMSRTLDLISRQLQRGAGS